MKQNKNDRPVSPIYIIAALWLLWPLLFPLASLIQYIPLILVTIVVYKFASSFVKKRKARKEREREEAARAARKAKEKPPEPRPEKPKAEATTGDPVVDNLIKQKNLSLGELRRLNDNIEDPKVSAQIDDLEATTGKIFDFVIAHPEKSDQIDQFFNYQLPTVLKILNSYDRLGSQGVEGENISGTMHKVEDVLDTVTTAFHKQLDNLFAGEALDVSTDITVLENLLKNQGLTDDEMGSMTTQQ